MADPYPGLREWAAAHADPPEQAGMLQARQVLELLAERDELAKDLEHTFRCLEVTTTERDRLREAPKPVDLPPCKTPGHYADCDCRWAATGEGGR